MHFRISKKKWFFENVGPKIRHQNFQVFKIRMIMISTIKTIWIYAFSDFQKKTIFWKCPKNSSPKFSGFQNPDDHDFNYKKQDGFMHFRISKKTIF